jgi:sulfite reductase beta subunit-like hemoprotein
MAESERYLPNANHKTGGHLLWKRDLEIQVLVMRMTGCPNGCARPWVS